jgi:hypothetical protein
MIIYNYNIILALVVIIHKPFIKILILLYNIDNNNNINIVIYDFCIIKNLL